MWFLLGVLCGALPGTVIALHRGRGARRPAVEKVGRRVAHPQKEWVQTRNFLYYDGTEMPTVKEEHNEQ